ncbi:MAG: RHS repeat-associated core domain-containing protein [Solirubrobacteraceae bacterium]
MPTGSLRQARLILTLALALALAGTLLAAGQAQATDFTWTGGSPEANWSAGTNWQGHTPPSGTVGTLSFPELTVPFEECTKLAATCYQSKNDVSGLNANAMTFGPFSLSLGYNFTGTGLTLGSGGLSTSGLGDAQGTISWGIPLTLGASQTWSLDQARLELEAEVTGSTAPLTVQFGFLGGLIVSKRVDVGPITLAGSPAYGGAVEIYNGSLNATDRNPVQLTEATLAVPSIFYRRTTIASTGPLTLSGESSILLGEPLAVAGSVKLDEASGVSIGIAAAPNPNGELTATGNVNLANASLLLNDYSCGAALAPGEVHTLVTTTGTLTGTFGGIPNGSIIPVASGGDGCLTDPPVRINYTSHSVTATAVQVEPIGGAPGYGEMAAGGHNPSEFCLMCFMGKLISFFLPVDAPTGNFWHTFNDLSVPGRGIPLDLTRTYNSTSAATDSPFGFGWSFPYGMSLSFPDATHVLVNQENGSQVTFTEGAGGTYTAPPRVTAALTHNGDGSWTFLRRHKDAFTFDASGKLTQEKDLNGYVTALAYNGSGQLSTVTDPAGRKLTFTYTSNRISSVTDPLGRVVNYAYDGEGNLTDVTDVNGGNTHFTYDASHRMLTMRFPNQAPGVAGSTGSLVSNKYDSQGRVVEQTDQLGRKTQFSYAGEPFGKAGGSTTITDAKGNVTVQDYQFGELISETKGFGTPQAATWTFGYDPTTLGMTTVTDPNGHTTTSTFDSEGNTLTTTDALGRTTTNTYDSLNDVLTTTDPLGVTTTNTYDSQGNLLSRARPLSGTSEIQTTTFAYGDASHPGDVTAMTDPEGKEWTYAYDAYGDRASVTDPLGDSASSTYNMLGWLASTTSARGNAKGANLASFTTTFAHNNFGQLTETVDPLGHKTISRYDPDQNLIASTDANGNTTTYTYDSADEQTATHRADGTTLQTTYWPDGTTKEQIDGAGHATSYEYDPLGRVSSVTDPLGRTTSYGYDPAGNRLTLTDPEGRVTTTAYDAANEPTSIAYSDGKTPNVTGITYDADGQRTGMTDGSGAWSWTWDSLHRLTSVAEGNNGTVNYHYDLRNDTTTIGYPDGHSVTRGYDDAGRWTSVTDWLGNTTNFSYDANNNLTSETLPNATGITDTSTYAANDTLSSISDKQGASTLLQANYTRDANSQVTGDSSKPAPEGGYGYNTLNQVCYTGSGTGSCASPPSGVSQYQYDSADNLTRIGTATQTFDAANQLTSTTAPVEVEPVITHEPVLEPPVIHNEIVPGPHREQGLPSVTSGKVAFSHTNGHGSAVSQVVSTGGANGLLLAFVSTREFRRGERSVVSVKGAGLKWRAVTNGSSSNGYLSVWQARAPKPLKRAHVSVRLHRTDAPAAVAVVGFDGGASVVGAARSSHNSGTPSVAQTVPADTAVWAVGQDALRHAKLKPLRGQKVLGEVNAPGSATSWLQSAAPSSAGRFVLGDSAPRSSSWMLGAVTIQERPRGRVARRSAALTAGPIASFSSPQGAAAVAARTPAYTVNQTSTFSYDAEGDRTGFTTSGGASQTHSYNQALELTGVGPEVSYAYNGDGLRTSKAVGASKTSFAWDIAGELPSLLEDGTNVYVYGPGGLPLEQVSGSTPLWFHHDQLGGTRLLTDATGAVQATYSYTPYGSVASSTGPASTPLLYAGQYRDSESGLYYLRARYYDPVTGQFLTVDPAVATTKARYGYAGENPLNWTDPSGLKHKTWEQILIGIISLLPGPGQPAGLGGGNPDQKPVIQQPGPAPPGINGSPNPGPTPSPGTQFTGTVTNPFSGSVGLGIGNVTNGISNGPTTGLGDNGWLFTSSYSITSDSTAAACKLALTY